MEVVCELVNGCWTLRDEQFGSEDQRGVHRTGGKRPCFAFFLNVSCTPIALLNHCSRSCSCHEGGPALKQHMCLTGEAPKSVDKQRPVSDTVTDTGDALAPGKALSIDRMHFANVTTTTVF